MMGNGEAIDHHQLDSAAYTLTYPEFAIKPEKNR